MDYHPPIALVARASELIRQVPDENPSRHIHQLLVCRLDLLSATAATRQTLSEARYKVLMARDPSITELDRATQQAASTAEIERDLEVLVGLDDLISEHIGLTVTSALTP